VFVIAVSLPHFSTTPDGVIRDTLEYTKPWKESVAPEWFRLFGGTEVTHVVGWNVLPVYLGWRISGSWLAERVMGLAWHALLAVTLCVLPIAELPGLPVTLAVTSATCFGLWLQRHHAGSELLLQQVLLIACLQRARTRLWWAVVAGVLVALLQYAYLATFVTLAYPLVILGWRRRTLLVYAVFVLGYLPAAYTWSDVVGLHAGYWDPNATQTHLLPKAWSLVAAFWDASYSQDHSWLWSIPGAQRLPPVACACILLGIVSALWSREGWRWIVLAVLGLVPSLVGESHLAVSHREMMALVPLGILAAWPLQAVPQRLAWPLSLAVAGTIAAQGLSEWLDPSFWVIWSKFGQHGF
jgi:hypothetical protein